MDSKDIDKISRMTESLEIVAEDTIQCSFFVLQDANPAYLDQLCESINSSIMCLSADYIWHRDEFKVYAPILKEHCSDVPAHLTSTVCFGDNLEDEWFIVYLILEITKIYKNIVVQVRDGDGEFLLIEAADFLPSWANPDTTDNRAPKMYSSVDIFSKLNLHASNRRDYYLWMPLYSKAYRLVSVAWVFIYQNNIHIIPPTLANVDDELSLKDAIKIVTEHTEETKAPNLQQAIMKRISDYPDACKDNFHRAVVKLPLEIAALLKIKPSLISPIVSMYCSHDSIDAKACKNMKLEQCLSTSVKFTKFMYAKLVHSKVIRNTKVPKVNENDKKSVLGLKLACGYEMIMSKLSTDVFSSREFHKFLKILTDSGYFRGNLEGSQQYNELMEKAKDYYLNTEGPVISHVSHTITDIIKTEEFNEIKASLQNQVTSKSDLIEDSEEWLNIHPEQLNDLLNSRYGKPSKLKNDDVISSNSIASTLSNFLKETSDFEGIESKEDVENESQEIDFDPDQFVRSLKSMLNVITSGDSSVDAHMLSDFSDDDDEMDEDIDEDDEDTELDAELKSKLVIDDKSHLNNESINRNIIQGIKEERAFSGPSSVLLRTIGINKTDILDSDDDIE